MIDRIVINASDIIAIIGIITVLYAVRELRKVDKEDD